MMQATVDSISDLIDDDAHAVVAKSEKKNGSARVISKSTKERTRGVGKSTSMPRARRTPSCGKLAVDSNWGNSSTPKMALSDLPLASPTRVWSPHTAALHRRRRTGEKKKDKNQVLAEVGGLSLEDEDEDEKELKLNKSGKECSSKHAADEATACSKTKQDKQASAKAAAKLAQEREKEDALQQSFAKLDPDTQAKVHKMLDPDTPMKERLSVEIEMMKHPNPEVRQVFSDIRYRVDNQSFLVQKRSTQDEMDAQMAKNLSQEAIRAAVEKKDLDGKRRKKLVEKQAEKEREKKLEAQVRTHQAKSIAQDAERLRQGVQRMDVGARETKSRKIKEEKEVEQAVHEFRETQGKHLTPTERVLKEALIEQRATKTANQFDSK
jgi:hypothetical protein